MKMKRIINLIRRPFIVSYRLSVWIDGKIRNASASKKRQLWGLIVDAHRHNYTWTLYKKGPLWLGERQISCSAQVKGGEK